MKNYREVNIGQAFDTIGREIAGQFQANETLEMRYVRVPKTEVLYSAHALEKVGNNIPELDGFQFIDMGNLRTVKGILEANLSKVPLPQEIRVIQPNWARKSWGVFFKDIK